MPNPLVRWNEQKTRWLLIGLLLIYLILFFPFWQPVTLGFLFAAACAPLITALRNRLRTRRINMAYLVMAAGVLIVIGAFAFVLTELYGQIADLVSAPGQVSTITEKANQFRDHFLAWANQQSYLQGLDIPNRLGRLLVGVTDAIGKGALKLAPMLLAATPAILLELFIFMIAYSTFLVLLPKIWKGIARLTDLGSVCQKHFEDFERICTLAIGSVLITALVQAFLAALGAAIAGFQAIGLIFAVTAVFATIPVLGAGSIPFTLMVISFAQGDHSAGIILLVTMLVVGTIDNLLRAWLFSRAAESNPVISLITLLGGIAIFGFAGLFIAPVLEQMVMKYVFGESSHASTTQS